MALVNQKTGQRQGNANFVLYQLYKNNPTKICASAASPAPTCIFYDLSTGSGNNSVACQGGTPNCSNTNASQFGVLVDPAHTTHPAWITTPGYDLATGLGSRQRRQPPHRLEFRHLHAEHCRHQLRRRDRNLHQWHRRCHHHARR